MLNNNLLATILTFVAALTWLRINDFAAHRGWISSRLSRKIIHMGTGPIYVLCWLLFKDVYASRFLAALVPLVITVQFVLVGFGVIKDDAAVQAMSRSGDPREILRGPTFYGIIFVVATIFYWLDNPIGMVALMLMCGGDGLADIIGRRWGTVKLPWSEDKSWVGSAGMLVGGWLFAVGIVWAFIAAGQFAAPLSAYLLPITIIAVIGTVVESVPIRDVDNITVTATALIAGHFLF
ncbi:MAG: phosphatidate cytidylyltransferase [Anaerolineales bacterium]|nr:phosphatidate cytidylyltransferase [Anaerolineales bacterium]